MTALDVERFMTEHHSGKLPSFTMIGAYTLIYVTERNDILCADCATEEIKRWQDNESDDPPVAYDTYLEGPSLFCENCNEEIESDYGDPWANKTEEN